MALQSSPAFTTRPRKTPQPDSGARRFADNSWLVDFILAAAAAAAAATREASRVRGCASCHPRRC
eukprot:388491-Pyramimonas_sp.AAC.1